jgi:sigma-E factor negative regulatory protein RseB
MQVARHNGPDGYKERVLTLDGTPMEVMRDGKSVTCTLPGGKGDLAGKRIPRNPFPGERWTFSPTVMDHYEFLDLGEGRVAGRACKVIGIKPRDGYRFGYRLWVDVETGLLLKSDLIDEDGELVEQVAFTRIDVLPEMADALVEPTLSGEVLHWAVAEDKDEPEIDGWIVDTLPPGFVQESVRKRKHGTIQRVYSDGIATVSVFVETSADGKKSLSGTSRMGAVSAFGTVINGHQVTVVGEVPLATVRTIGESLIPGY